MNLEAGQHDHIVKILGHGSLGIHTGSYFIDLEYCDINLEEYIRGSTRPCFGLYVYQEAQEDGHLPLIICAIMQQILSGLTFIHEKGKVHRDLKPRNSMHT